MEMINFLSLKDLEQFDLPNLTFFGGSQNIISECCLICSVAMGWLRTVMNVVLYPSIFGNVILLNCLRW